MKIIDAHIHFNRNDYFDQAAQEAGHLNDGSHLGEVFRQNHIVLAVAMGAGRGGDEPRAVVEPLVPDSGDGGGLPDFIAYCCGLESDALTAENLDASLEAFARRIDDPRCVGLKLYPGYNQVEPDDALHRPFYELAERSGLPVVIHTGDTAMASAKLKYAHPLRVDDLAVRFPDVRFVMAHYGNPWIVDATAVAAKNANVFIDLSGLAAGRFAPEWFNAEYRAYLDYLKMWITYLGDYGKFLYGSDWPLVNIEAYLEVIRSLIPERAHEAVFSGNALEVFPKLRGLLPEHF